MIYRSKATLIIIIIASIIVSGCSSVGFANSSVSKVEEGTAEWAFTRSGQHPEKLLIQLMDQTESTLDVAIYSLTHPEIISALKRAAQRGVTVRIIADHSQAQGRAMTEALKILGSSNIAIKLNRHSGLMHLKMVVSDQKIATTGSFNFSKAAATKNDEVLVVLNNKDIAQSFTEEFVSMWEDTDKYESIQPKIASADSVAGNGNNKAEPQAQCQVPKIKGNDHSQIYHVPGQKYYESLKEPRLFCSEADAKAAGYRKSKI